MNLKDWRKSKGLTQEELADKVRVLRNTYQAYESGRIDIPHDVKARIEKMGYDGPWPKDTREGNAVATVPPELHNLRDYNPGEYAAEAYLIVAEAAAAGGAPLDSLDPKAVAEVVGSIADAVAQGRGEEARMRLVRKAETILQAMKK